MSFEDLQRLKEKIGSKVYNKQIFGTPRKSEFTSHKRANKNRPREVSSKKPEAQKQLIVNLVKKPLHRDPRFDPLCGTYNDEIFKSNYKFLTNVRKNERMELEKQYKEEADPKIQKKIKFLMQRMVCIAVNNFVYRSFSSSFYVNLTINGWVFDLQLL